MNAELAELAAIHGVATWYMAGDERRVDVAEEVLIAVLDELGVRAGTAIDIGNSLREAQEHLATSSLPATIVLRQSDRQPLPEPAVIHTEDGITIKADKELPAGLPLGWHRLRCGDQDIALVIAPDRLPEPPQAWGWMIQLYALHSACSWGMGDFADLTDFLSWAGKTRADIVLLNPVNAITPTASIQASPYSPTSRRFTNPLYLRIEDTWAYRSANDALKAAIDDLAVPVTDRIDYDAVWQAKMAALELLFSENAPDEPQENAELTEFATFCALAEKYGAQWQKWPFKFQHPDSENVKRVQEELNTRVRFHAWVQHLCTEQLAAVKNAAKDSGMRIGVIHDLPIGVDPGGADSWSWQDVLAEGISVGAPPDSFNQLGQDWSLPPWNPQKLAKAEYGPYRDLLRALFKHANGIRIDHIAGLWRLWWIPRGRTPDQGTYVHYDADAMLGILALEAHRAGAYVIGEDLGTVEARVTQTLHDNNMLSSAVLWFQCDKNGFLPANKWHPLAAASISTHDLPTAAGFLQAENVRIRIELDLLTKKPEDEYAQATKEKQALIDLLISENLISANSSDDDVIVAMHAFLAKTPCRFLFVSPYDVLGITAQPNLPGTIDSYPNWRMPLPVSLAEFITDPRVAKVSALLSKRSEPAG